MPRAILWLVALFMFGGISLMVGAFEVAVKLGGIVGADLMIVSAIGALISTVGLGVFAIVSAIRDLPHQS